MPKIHRRFEKTRERTRAYVPVDELYLKINYLDYF